MTIKLKKIAVVGLGRVGLPLAASLHEVGFAVHGIDTNEKLVAILAKGGAFPFHEPGYETIPHDKRWSVRADYEGIDDVDAFIVTVGTPLDINLIPNLKPIKHTLARLSDELAKGKLLIFRSTLGLGVTKAITKRLVRTGACLNGEPNVAYCPERLAEGKAYDELRSLPQIVSTDRDDTFEQCVAIFENLAPRIHRVSLREAELIKLLCNTSRYMQFAVSNWVHEFVLDQGIDPHSLLAIANDGYPRPIPDRPGFTAGTCLRKDYGLLVQDNPLGDFAIATWRVHERQPLSLLRTIQSETDLKDKTVAILGIGFKRDVDDLRDSLALKFAELTIPTCAALVYHDPFVDGDMALSLMTMESVDMDAVRRTADVIVIGANHSAFDDLATRMKGWERDRDRLVIDIWNSTGFGRTVTHMPLGTDRSAAGSNA